MLEPTTNRLRVAILAAVHQVTDATGHVSPSGGNPLDAQLRTLQDAWVTSPPSTPRRDAEDDLREAGTRILAGFRAVEDACSTAGHREPLEVPEDDWRASFIVGHGPV
ncbi:hypothetical protein [Cellulomonas fengjieae]|uniref:Uncharacterized protein n=1 Tax=Cellulomonas fengjieae TaxID=2819978 RepID=A0ABS3SF67_9CELL|nr:hypothetical protein [Cellulomonas fengjieae]MBO3084400.1 hypothetical protein [Cellulomonas fengjieae]MBO3103172.1 hypothetical protein [Cellulomonas fengjieae]QVI67253.1 hypothetical protein KG102_06695 [Cellulomonas fengjieae]